MKCLIDGSEMEEGSLVGEGGWWRKKGLTTQFKNMFGKNFGGATSIFAYHCPKCGKIELTTEVK